METNIFDIYDLNTGMWKVGKLPVNIYDAHILQIENKIFIVGGMVNGQPSSKIWELEYKEFASEPVPVFILFIAA